MMKLNRYLIIIVLFTQFSCEKILEIDPLESSIDEEEALQTKSDMQEFLNSAYEVTANANNGRIQGLGELLSDNLVRPNNNNDLTEVFIHNVLIFNETTAGVYKDPYIGIFRANRILEYLDEKDFGYTPSELNTVKGECHFLRGFLHFQEVTLWAQPWGYTAANTHPGVIYKLSSTVEPQARPSVAEVYDLIIQDLQSAIDELPFQNGIYATKYAAQALLAKVYFQQGRYDEAVQLASEVIDNGPFSLDPDINRFKTDISQEAVFSTVSFVTPEGVIKAKSTWFSDNYGKPGNNNPTLTLSREFYDDYASDTSDTRLSLIEVLNPGEANELIILRKFGAEYFNIPILHLTDLKLIRAEALALLNTDLSTAIQDVNDIRERAYGGSHNNLGVNVGASSIIEAARHERRIEMIGEGDRIQQVKRRGAIENEDLDIRDHSWDCNGMIIQFPSTQRTELFELNPTGGC